MKEHGHSEQVRPIRIRIHMRFVKKVVDRASLRNEADKINFDNTCTDLESDRLKPQPFSHKDDLRHKPEHRDETRALFRKNSTERLRPRKKDVNYKL